MKKTILLYCKDINFSIDFESWIFSKISSNYKICKLKNFFFTFVIYYTINYNLVFFCYILKFV